MSRRWIWAALALLLLVTGCWDNREPRRRAYVLGMGIDRSAESPDKLMVTLQIPIARTGGKSGAEQDQGRRSDYYLIKGEGRTLQEAIHRAQDRISREVYFGQIRSLAVSDELSVEQWRHFIDEIKRNPDIEETVYMVLTRGRASIVMGVETDQERLPALYFNAVFEAIQRQSTLHAVRLWEFWRANHTSGLEPVLPVARPGGPKQIEVNGIAVFHGPELKGLLEGEAAHGYMWLTGRTNANTFMVETEGLSAGVRSLRAGRSVSVRFERGNPVFTMRLQVSGEVDMFEEDRTGTEEVLHKVEKGVTARIESQMKTALQLIQKEYRSDVLGFGKMLYYRAPAYFDAVRWDEVFPKVKVETHVVVNLRRKGTLH